MSRIQRALLTASLSAISLSTLTLGGTTSAADPKTATATTAATDYVVKPGDFLAGIAAKVGVALPDLLTANNMTTKSLILPGDTLMLPAQATPPAQAPAKTVTKAGGLVYTVKFGDFLLGIATAYKVTLADLLAVNNLTVKSLITPGRQLSLPANAVAPRAEAPATSASVTGPSDPSVSSVGAVSRLTYTVKFDDFLAGIASKYKVKLNDLLAVNKLKATSLIVPGASWPYRRVPSNRRLRHAALIESTAGPAGVVVAYAYAQTRQALPLLHCRTEHLRLLRTGQGGVRPDRQGPHPSQRFTGHLRQRCRLLERADQGRRPCLHGDPRQPERRQPRRHRRRCHTLDPRPGTR